MALPSGYTELEYIESTGEQYLDAGFVPDQDTRVYAECVLPIAASTQALFGCRVSSSSRQFQFVTQGGYYRSDYNTTISNFTTHDYGTEKFYVDKNKQNTDLNGEYSTSQTYGTFTCPGNMYIFATNNNGSVYALAVARLYVLKRWANGTLANHFIPCKTSAGEVGMWDDVNGVFCENKGTGVFIAGPEVAPPDPMAPHDGHNTNIGSTSFEIESGTALIGGVVREIERGTVLVNGVMREIALSVSEPESVVGTLVVSGYASKYSYVVANGEKITAAGTYEYMTPLELNVVVQCYASGAGSWIKVDGETVATKTTSGELAYTLTTNSATVTVDIGRVYVEGYDYNATVTTQ